MCRNLITLWNPRTNNKFLRAGVYTYIDSIVAVALHPAVRVLQTTDGRVLYWQPDILYDLFNHNTTSKRVKKIEKQGVLENAERRDIFPHHWKEKNFVVGKKNIKKSSPSIFQSPVSFAILRLLHLPAALAVKSSGFLSAAAAAGKVFISTGRS